MMRYRAIAGILATAALVAACGGGGSVGGPASQQITAGATCPPPPAIPTPYPAWLAYPPSGSSSVSTSIGQIIERGWSSVIIAAGNSTVTAGTPTAAPSPFPTPFATAPPQYDTLGPYIAVPLPTLSPNTTYTVEDQYTGWDDNPPQCSTTLTQTAGTFTTGN